MIKLEDKKGNEIEVSHDYSGAEVLHGEGLEFGSQPPANNIEAAYFFNDLYQILDTFSNNKEFYISSSPYTNEVYACLLEKGFLETLSEEGYGGSGQPYFDGSDGIFTNQISYNFLSLDKEK